jgi:hydroxymethylbilane synthase
VSRKLFIATRGSALALAQARNVLAQCRAVFPGREFELQIIKTTGDRLQTASLAQTDPSLPKGLFTKELEVALLEKTADIAVHSLKDLPTELPEGLKLGAVGQRADVRDVLLYRDAGRVAAASNPLAEWRPGTRPRAGFAAGLRIEALPQGAVVATSSTRRAALLLARRPDLRVVPIRGNVGTRLEKLIAQDDMDATILAAAGLGRLRFDLSPRSELRLDPHMTPAQRAESAPPPEGVLGTILEPEEMLPAVGQGAVGLEIRANDPELDEICEALNHTNTWLAVTAERAFLRAVGGGCQSPIAGYARVIGHRLHLRGVVFDGAQAHWAEGFRPAREAAQLGHDVAATVVKARAK